MHARPAPAHAQMAALTLLSLLASAAADGPCDIYARGKTPCVAAHSMTRALYGSYSGPLYSVMKIPENKTIDIRVKTPGGVADSAAQDAFCGSSVCIVQRIYDQSPQQNHLGIEQGEQECSPPRRFASAGVNFNDDRAKAMLSGQLVYSAVFVGDPDYNSHDSKYHSFVGQGYSNRSARGTATGDQPHSMYAVLSGKHYNGGCCFDYGNAENGTFFKGSVGDGSMEAIYYGTGYAPQGPGSGKGPWVMDDMENGIYAGGSNQASVPSLVPVDFVAAMVKGDSGNHYSVKAGDAQKTNSLETVYDGPRPKGYEVMKKQGAIILGIGGDNSPWAAGTFYEGAMTTGYASDETDAAVMDNIVAAMYGK